MEINNIFNSGCTNCSLFSNCHTVCMPGKGGNRAKLMIIGINPTKKEDGLGKYMDHSYLNKILFDVLGLTPDLVYYTSLIKCHDPLKQYSKIQIDACLEYLNKEIEVIKPDVIITLGKTVFDALTGEKLKLKKQVGTWFTYNNIDVLPTYHFSYASGKALLPIIKTIGRHIYKGYCKAYGVEHNYTDTKIVEVDSVEHFKTLINYCKEAGICCFDFETTDLEIYKDGFKVTLLSISFQPGVSYVLPIQHFELEPEYWYVCLALFHKEIICNKDIIKLGHNIKFDLKVLYSLGFKGGKGRVEDTLFQSHFIDDTKPKGLKVIVEYMFPAFAGYEEEVVKYGYDKIPLDELQKYGGSDTDLTLRVWLNFTTKLLKTPDVYRCYRNLYCANIWIFSEYEHRGIPINLDILNEGLRVAENYLELIEQEMRNNFFVNKFEMNQEIFLKEQAEKALQEKLIKWQEKHPNLTKTEIRMADKLRDIRDNKVTFYEGVNFSSPAQLSKLFYSEKGFNWAEPFNPKTKKKGGTGVEGLKQINDKTGFIDLLLEYRSLGKTYKTYLKGFKEVLGKDGNLHPSFHLVGTRTGRVSSSKPNVQNITQPSRVKYKRAKEAAMFIKKMFCVPEGYTLLQVDFSQLELRLIAMFSQCELMLNTYKDKGDIHTLTAVNTLGFTDKQYKALSKADQKLNRFKAKAVNFGFVYGAMAETFRQYAKNQFDLEFTYEEAEEIRDNYFDLYPEIENYHEEAIELAEKNWFAKTLFGSRRQLVNINSDDFVLKSTDERAAINTPIQGTGGQMALFAIALLNNILDKRVLLWNTIHDSILYLIPNDLVDLQKKLIKRCCENLPVEEYFGFTFKGTGTSEGVAMLVDFEKSISNWDEMEDF